MKTIKLIIRIILIFIVIFGPSWMNFLDIAYGDDYKLVWNNVTIIPNPVYDVAVGDLDNDGKLEIIVTDAPSNGNARIYIFENAGDNSYMLVWDSNTIFTMRRCWIEIGDQDSDGKLEIIALEDSDVSPSYGKLRVIENNGNNTYEEVWNSGIAFNNMNVGDLFLGDADSDGKREIILKTGTYWGHHEIRIYENYEDNSYQEVWNSGSTLWDDIQEGAVGDIDADGKKEIIVGSGDDDSKVYVFENTGIDNSFEIVWNSGTKFNNQVWANIGELDGDGKGEIIAGGQDGIVHVFENIGDNNYMSVWNSGDMEDFFFKIVTGDQDSDGNKEIIMPSTSGRVYIFENIGDNSYQESWNSKNTINNQIYRVAVGDQDSDGKGEIIAACYDGKIYVFEHDDLDKIAPSVPHNPMTKAGSQKIILTWTKNTDSDMAYYKIYRSQAHGFTPSPVNYIAKVDHPDTIYVDIGLVSGQNYYYRISAVDSAGNESDFSDEVNAMPLESNILLSSTQYYFGNVLVDSSESRILTIKNIGVDTLIISDVNWKYPVFSVSDTSGLILPDDSLEIIIIFMPNDAQIFDDSLTIISNDPYEPIIMIFLNGKGGYLFEPKIVLSDTIIDFIDTPKGSQSYNHFYIKNIGTDTLKINYKIKLESVFEPYFSSNLFIIPGDSIKVVVFFQPDFVQVYKDTLIILSNDPEKDTSQVILNGRGMAIEPDIEISSKEYDFGQVEISNFKDWWLTINNVGTEILNVYDINWNQTVFTLSDTSFSIPTNDSFKVKMTFKPTAIQNYEDILTIISNDPDEDTLTIFLAGRGIPPPEPERVSVLPNLFTPNGDGYNDYVEFKYPKMYEEKPEILIFNLKGRKVKKINDFSNYEYRWYGTDDDGKELDPGVYIYILEVGGKRISSGTITLIR